MKWRNIACVVVTLFTSMAINAQEVIDEDFIDILSKNAGEILSEQDADFSVNTIPEKWINESAVTIGYKKHILFDKKRSGLLGGKENLVLLEKKRMKIKLIDKKAVEDFSELYFRYSSKFDGFGAFVYKEDGSKKEISLIKAVSIEDNDRVPEFFKSFFDQNVRNRHEYYKVPVADLLPGDVLEFVSQTSSTLNVKRTPYYQFDPQYELCQKGMPVMMHKIIIETDNNSFITARSINGAPEFQQSLNGDFNVYTWADKNRERLKDVAFINEYMVLPLVKFQITYTDGREFKSLFAGIKGQIKNNFDAAEIGRRAFANYNNVGSSYVYGAMGVTVDALAGALWAKMKANGGKDAFEDEFIKMAYYYLRHTQVFNNYYYSGKQFCYLLGRLLENRKISSEVIVTTPNNLTTPADLLFESELTWCLQVKGKYIFKATEHSNLYDIDEDMINNEAYKLPSNAKGQTETVKIIDTRLDDNKSLYQVFVALDSSQKWLNVERTSAYSGIQKEKNSYTALRFTPYMFSDTRTYNGPDDFENVPDKYSSQIFQQKKAITDEFKERKPVYMKEQAEKDLAASIRYTNFEMTSEGRSFKKPELMFKEKFQVGDKIKRAGKKLLVNLPGLMGAQLQIKKEERTRNFDIDVRYPRKLRWQINLTVPQGYTVEGLEGLTAKVDNETGSFLSTATMKDNVVTVDIQKIYKQKNISKDKWPLMLAFIDAAYNFSHKLILLKPVK
ncbi:MAG TPA: hypothetical protein VI461_00775 [Chitinophagaceae bacterium]|nr:hypothetical protein [Chitinophagaceae bacterium]